MQDIEPYYSWRNLYAAEEDPDSPFFGREYSEFNYTNTIYNYYLHPQWDEFGSTTLYLKILYVDYEKSFAILEFIGEWNDAINNDIMFLKRDVLDILIEQGIQKFIFIGENVLNFHGSDDCYYEELFQDIEDGWVVALNFREHVLRELSKFNIDYYLAFGGALNTLNWRTYLPLQLFEKVESVMTKRLQ